MFLKHPPYSQIHVLRRRDYWSLWWDAFFLIETLKKLGIHYSESRFAYQQVVYLPSKYAAPRSQYHLLGNRVVFDYFHGDPSKMPQSQLLLDQIKKNRSRFSGIRVSHSGMEAMLLNENFERKVFKIPIGVELDWFNFRIRNSRKVVREELKIPQSAAVIGSFQKDGVGWGKGMDPKLIKGPDVLLKTLECLKSDVPELFVLLTGPARGYVKAGLEKIAVPYRHATPDYREIPKYYCALDAYVVSSREEGGPKAVLESMASGIPLVTTRVGQAMDLVVHQENGWMTDIGDAEGLAHWLQYAIENTDSLESVLAVARQTAVDNCYAAQIPLWGQFLRDIVI